MPNGWSFNWESMATRERESLEPCFAKKDVKDSSSAP
jgi:hypothetical protein